MFEKIKETLLTLATSKKAIATVVGVILVLTNRIGLQLPEEQLTAVITPIVAYIVGQGLADFGKEKHKVPMPMLAVAAVGSAVMSLTMVV